jgi:hypothetical protein
MEYIRNIYVFTFFLSIFTKPDDVHLGRNI